MTGRHGSTGAIRRWTTAVFSGAVALAALVAGSVSGKVSAHRLDPRLVAWISAGVLVVFGAVATTRMASLLSRSVAGTMMPAATGAVRIVSAAVGYLVVIFGALAILNVSITHLLVGVGLAGIVLGIAAQQSLGNVFAGVVLVLAKPFQIGDRIRIRSGALGGMFEAWVREMSLTYTTLETDEGDLRVPNAAMLAAGVGRITPTPPGSLRTDARPDAGRPLP